MIADFLVIGSGIAGMSAALRLSKLGSVIIVTKSQLVSGSTPWAQGGIASPKLTDDSLQLHKADTLKVGGGLCDEDAVNVLVNGAQDAIDFLAKNGVSFGADPHREAGHSMARIWHSGDTTGLSIANALAESVRNTEVITVIEEAFVNDLLVRENTVHGAEMQTLNGNMRAFASRTILASGGAANVYEEHTTPPETTGDGIAIAARAGADIADLEFVQFHPTALATNDKPLFLLSETLRGEGALIVDKEGDRLFNPLLPRDQLSRNIYLAEQNGQAIFLDLRHRPDEYWASEFETIFKTLQEYGLSPQKDLIPIIPAAHFFCGGIATDLRGRTSLKHLAAVGEVARTGVHGANRLASNSLLEGVVFSEQIYRDYLEQIRKDKIQEPISGGHFDTVPFVEEQPGDTEVRERIQNICWSKIGIIRTLAELESAADELQELTATGSETKHMLTVAKLLVQAAKKRTVSAGCHFIAQ
jgi:L-aspartate oxidase